MSKILDLWADMTGVVLDYALSAPPSAAWLMCYGQALTAGDASAARLRAKLLADGSPYGVDGSGNPLVPDGRGRVFAGKDDMGGAAASRLTTAGAGINGAQLGATGGAQTHALTTAQLAAHNHGVNDPGHGHNVYDPGHAHGVAFDSARFTGGGTIPRMASPGSETSVSAAATGISIYAGATGISTQNNGSGTAHNNTQPTAVLNKIIKL